MSEPINIFRQEYKELDSRTKQHVLDVKDKANELFHLFPKNGEKGVNREISLAITKLEETVMWAIKGMTK